ncbi:ATP-binding protein [Alcaligenaceae bacterium]|nr:ATP-binding protein [Alcaligenaceae bacterium]
MKLILENIGMLRHAEITLHPLCVVAGENDNGKSTVGKIVFCLIKAINRYKEDLQESKEHRAQEKLDELYFTLRRLVGGRTESTKDLLFELRRSSANNEMPWQTRVEAMKEVIDNIKKNIDIDSKSKENILKNYEEVQGIAFEPEDARKSIENAFNKVFASEFDSSLLHQGASQGTIRLLESDIELIHLKIDERNRVSLQNDVEPLELKDATFIDSPLILNYHDLLIRSQSMLDIDRRHSKNLGLAYTTLHTKDLFDKLREPILPNDLFSIERPKPLMQFQSIIDGEISYDKSIRDFVFRRDQEDISIKNTASGIKVFGLLQILLDNELVTKNTMLIFDEPENHLHPKWQLKLAELLVALAGMGVYVLVSSHSPYIIEALKRYSEQPDNKVASGFFLAKNRKIEDTDSLSEIFTILAEPFKTFQKMDAEELRDE